ncbi:hypothetical protein V7O66_13910 [Methanolobus sp. ZRKC3]|uniref:hypothetical protein n=1 Tax=Methanolobus sp. ZRKC3 TaxID=3125786 RepID=UPI003244E137
MSKMTAEQLREQLPSAHDELAASLAKEPRFVASIAKSVGHVEINGKLVEVQLTLERDSREWMDEEFADEVEGN